MIMTVSMTTIMTMSMRFMTVSMAVAIVAVSMTALGDRWKKRSASRQSLPISIFHNLHGQIRDYRAEFLRDSGQHQLLVGVSAHSDCHTSGHLRKIQLPEMRTCQLQHS